MRAPILLLVFNRPEPTERVFEAIRLAAPERLYIAADGPRSPLLDGARCAQVRELVSAVDWPCEVSTLFRDENLGCRRAVSSALDWFFEREPEGVVLEDDCLPSPSFFSFCEELLERYRDDERVACISGNWFHGDAARTDTSYCFSRYPHVWGWATWRRAWSSYDVEMSAWDEMRRGRWLHALGAGEPRFERYWKGVFDATRAGRIDTWDFQWTFACWRRGALSIVPRVNLVRNIGFGADATHTTVTDDPDACLRADNIAFPLLHPQRVERDPVCDLLTTWRFTRTMRPLHRRLLGRVRQAVRDRSAHAMEPS